MVLAERQAPAQGRERDRPHLRMSRPRRRWRPPALPHGATWLARCYGAALDWPWFPAAARPGGGRALGAVGQSCGAGSHCAGRRGGELLLLLLGLGAWYADLRRGWGGGRERVSRCGGRQGASGKRCDESSGTRTVHRSRCAFRCRGGRKSHIAAVTPQQHH
jgi:hypothetical protein